MSFSMLKHTLLAGSLLLLATAVHAQSTTVAPALNPTDPTVWGQPVAVVGTSPVFQKRGLAAVPLQVQVRFYKKVIQSCQYEYQVTNTSPTQAVFVKMYALSDQKHGEFIGPGKSVLLPVDTSRGGSKKEGNTPCLGQAPTFTISEVQPR